MSRNFDGVDDRINVGDVDAVRPFTLYAWSRWETGGPLDMVMIGKEVFGTRIFSMRIRNDTGNLRFNWATPSPPTNRGVQSTGTTNSGEWNFVACVVRDSGADTEVDMYINGNAKETKTGTGQPPSTSDLDVYLGADHAESAGYWKGDIAYIGLINADLTEDQIETIRWLGPLFIDKTDMVGHWPLWGVASPEPDLSGNVNNGTVSGATLADHAPRGPYIRPSLAGWDEAIKKQIAVSDSLTGADSRSIQANVPISDSFVGADARSITVQVPISDALTGSEVLALEKPFAISDSLSGAEVLTIQANITATDSLTGASALVLQVQVPISDLIKFNLKPLRRHVRLGDIRLGEQRLGESEVIDIKITDTREVADSFVGTDARSIQATIPISDALAFLDARAIEARLALSDALAGAEALAIQANISVSDALVGTDSMAITVQVPISDTLSGAEALLVTNQISLSDTLVGSDARAIQVSFTIVDSMVGADQIQVNVPIPVSDAVSFFQSPIKERARLSEFRLGKARLGDVQLFHLVTGVVDVTEAFLGADARTITAQIPVSDSMTGSETLLVEVVVDQSDALTGADARAIEARVPITDSMSLVEALAINVSLALSDSFVGAEVIDAGVRIFVSDSMTGADIIDILRNINITDALALFDRRLPTGDTRLGRFRLGEAQLRGEPIKFVDITVFVPVSDTLTGSENIAIKQSRAVSDSFAGLEVIDTFISVTPTDSMVGSEVLVIQEIIPPTPPKAPFVKSFMILFDVDEE